MHTLINFFSVPSGIIAVLLLGALIAFLLKKRTQTAVAVASAAFLYLVFSSSITVEWLMGGLEQQYPAEQDMSENDSVEVMVVLTGHATNDPARPLTGRMNSASALRVLEAARLYQRNTRKAIYISGGQSVTTVMRDLMLSLGVPDKNIILESESSSTFESAVHLMTHLSERKFLLITSAGHMPRAIQAFHAQGLHPVPAPTDYLTSSEQHQPGILPSARNLMISDLAVHEYLGMFWYWSVGRL